MNALWGLLGGVVGAGVVVGILAYRKKGELDLRAAGMQASLETGGNELEAYMLQQGTALQVELAKLAQMTSDPLARATAEDWLSQAYGLTPRRFQQLSQLSQLWD